MPTSGDYIIYDDTGITNDFTTTWSYYTSDHTQQMWDRQDRIIEAQMREAEEQCYQEMKRAEELREDKRRYPLFFIKEGIV